MLNALESPHFASPIFRRALLIPTLVIGVHVIALPSLAQDKLLPVNPNIVAGEITISQPNGTSLQVDQNTQHGVINWDGFSIGKGHSVSFDNGTGATLNRVTGNNLSEINGQLNATGSLFLINQNGVVFGENGIVRTGQDFLVSTLNVADSDFLNGGDTVFSGDNAGFILNLGEISSLGGDVALISKTVRNQGLITAESGRVGLIAGRDVLMRDGTLNEGKFLVRLGGADTEVEEAGIIRAAAAELRANGGNIYALAGNTQGSIQAKAVAKSGGRIFLTAGKSGAVKLHKKLTARDGNSGGKILVTGGVIDATSLIDASGLEAGGLAVLYAQADARFSGEILTFGDRKSGNGGFIEVSGQRQLSFAGQVDTGGGTLLLDPQNIEILEDFGGEVSPSLQNASIVNPDVVTDALATGNVVIHTSGTGEDAGTILVSDRLNFESENDLTLIAHGDILVDADIRNSSATGGDVNLIAGWDGETGGVSFTQGVFNNIEFDITSFDALDLADQTGFGNSTGQSYTIFGSNAASSSASGSVLINSQELSNFTQIASRGGLTRVYANDIDMGGDGFYGDSGGDSYYGSYSYYDAATQIGFSIFPDEQGSNIVGDIDVRATGNINIDAASRGAHAQIGHVGPDVQFFESTFSGNAAGDISVTALGDITLTSGEPGAYAMIGHGSGAGTFNEIEGLRAGDIFVSGANISLINGFGGEGGSPPLAWIGHETPTKGGISNSDLSVVASSFNADSASTSQLRADILDSAWQAGSVNFSIGSDVELSEALVTDGDNNLTIQSTTGAVEINANSQIVSNGAGDIVLAAAGLVTLSSDFDSELTVTDGRWVVYSNAPNANDGHVGLANRDAIEFDVGFSEASSSGNVLAYAVSPELIYTASDQDFTYAGIFNQNALSLEIQVGEESATAADYGLVLDGFNPRVTYGDAVTFSTSNEANVGNYVDGVVVALPEDASVAAGITLSTVDGDLTISQRDLLIQPIGGFSKIYDGATEVSTSNVDFFEGSGPVQVDEVLVSVTGIFEDKNVGTQKQISDLTGTLTGADAGNYRPIVAFESEGEILGSITPRALAVDASPQDRIYDGTADASLSFSDNRIQGDDIALSVTAEFEDKNVGTNKTVEVIEIGLSGADAENYQVAEISGGTADITARDLNVTIEVDDKTYDGTTAAQISFMDDGLDGDDISLSATATFETKTAGQNKTLTVSDVSLDGIDSPNYTLLVDTNPTAEIFQRELFVQMSAEDKVYDGTDAAVIQFDATPLETDAVTVTGSGMFADKTVGEDKLVTAADVTLLGSDAENYFVVAEEVTEIANITPRALNIFVSAEDKTYDGTQSANVSIEDNRVDGDVIVVSGSAEFNDENVGVDKLVNIFGVGISGSDAQNYEITTETVETADITPRELTLTAAAEDKIYDGQTDAVVNIFIDEIEGDDVAVTGIGAFESKDVGIEKPVSVSQIALSGTDAPNYTASTSTQSSADISARLLTLTLSGQDRVFDGSTDVDLDVSDDRIEGDDITVTATGEFQDSEPGQDKPITIIDFSVTGPDAANYQAAQPNNFTQASISPAQTRESARPQPQINERAPEPVAPPSIIEPGFGVYSDVATDALVRDLTTASEFCRQIGESEYVIDCLGDRLAEIAKRLPANGAYAESREALATAARKLEALVRENASNALPPLRVATRSLSGGGGQNRVLRAVEAANIASVTEQAVAILQEAETVLLRSAESSQRRRVHYQRIATAVGSNKLLLRST